MASRRSMTARGSDQQDRRLAMPLSFTSSGDYPIGDDPVDLAVADLNGDGTPDIVTVNRHDGTLTFLRGNGDGTFSEVGGFPIGSFPAAIELADLNGDGAADLVVADKDNGTVDVVLGDGNGGFLPQTNLATADTLPLSVAVGDLNGDGKLDLVTGSAAWGDTSVSVLLGNGDGTFQEQVPYSVPGASNAVALADLNGDGKADLVAGSSFTSVLLGNGDGTFQAPDVVGYGGYSVAIADLNGDQILDLVKTQGTSVLVQLGNGDGTFQEQTSYADGPGSFRVAVADLDGDGRPDLAVDGDYGVQVLLGNGDGTFQPAQSFSVDLPHAVAIADLNNDGKPDIVTVNATDTMSILFNTPNVPPTIRLFDDTGASASDNITVNPILTGTGTPGTAGTLMEGTTVLGTRMADGTGTWGFIFPTLPTEGSHTVKVNTAGCSASLALTLDRSLVTPTIGLPHDTGASASDHVTSDATLTGTTDAGAAVGVYDLTGVITGGNPNPVLLATVTADAGGTWSYTPSLPDGPHVFMAHATDLAGNVRDSGPLYMTLDTTAPTIRLFDDTGASASDNITVNPILTGTATPGTAVTLMEGTTVLGTGTVDGTGRWAFLPTIEQGSHTVTVNTAGGSSSLAFTFDNSLATPTIGLAHDTGANASDHVTSDATLTGTTEAGAAVGVYDLTGVITGGNPNPVLLATVTADAGGTWSYTPSLPDGPHVFMAHATDLAGNMRDSAPLYMTLATTPPVAVDDGYSLAEDTTLTLAAPAILANDSDADGDTLSAALVSGPAHGRLALNTNGALTHPPPANFNGTDSFAYKGNDAQADSNVATVFVTVTPVNDAPVAHDDSYTLNHDTSLTITAAGVLANDSDLEGDPLSALLVSGPAHGSLSLTSDGAFTYTPAANFSGTDSFTYKANDGQTDSNVATVNLTITSANHAPVTNDDIAGVAKGQTITANVQHGVLANDTDPDGNSLSVSAVNGSAANVGHAVVGTYGSLTINGDGSYSYVASKLSLPSQAVAHDSFDYTASDGHGGTSTAALTVTITNPGMVYRAGTDGNDTLIAGSSQSVLDGGNGNDILKGSGTADVLIGGRGADIMTGGNGPDTFLFGPNFGNDVITDFKPHNDVIQFDHSLFASFADLHAADDGHGNTVITYDASDTVTLQGVALANLHASDFLFV